VAAFETGGCVVGNLVAFEADRFEEPRRRFYAVQNCFVVGNTLQPALVLERVDGAVAETPVRERCEKGFGVPRRRVARVAENQVDSGIVEAGLYERERARRVASGVAAAHSAKSRIVERLDAHRDAVDANGLKLVEFRGRDVERVELDGEFGFLVEKGSECAFKRRQVAERRRSAPKIKGL
jgi:hypothetical protein